MDDRRTLAASWQIVSEQPLIFACEDFLSPAECDAVVALAEADCRVKDTRLDYYSKVRVELDVDESGGNAASEGEAASGATVLAAVDAVVAKLSGDSPSHADEMRWQVHFTPVTGGEEGGVEDEADRLEAAKEAGDAEGAEEAEKLEDAEASVADDGLG